MANQNCVQGTLSCCYTVMTVLYAPLFALFAGLNFACLTFVHIWVRNTSPETNSQILEDAPQYTKKIHFGTIHLEKFILGSNLGRKHISRKTSQELRMLSGVTINCQVTKIVRNPGSQLSVL